MHAIDMLPTAISVMKSRIRRLERKAGNRSQKETLEMRQLRKLRIQAQAQLDTLVKQLPLL